MEKSSSLWQMHYISDESGREFFFNRIVDFFHFHSTRTLVIARIHYNCPQNHYHYRCFCIFDSNAFTTMPHIMFMDCAFEQSRIEFGWVSWKSLINTIVSLLINEDWFCCGACWYRSLLFPTMTLPSPWSVDNKFIIFHLNRLRCPAAYDLNA